MARNRRGSYRHSQSGEWTVIAIDKEISAVAVVSIPYEYFEKVTDEFRDIQHYKEIEGDREKYLKEYFKPTLEKVQRKYPIRIKYFVKVNPYFWNYIDFLAKSGLELIVDDGLWEAFRHRFSGAQISLVKEGNIKKNIKRLKRELREARKRDDFQRIVELERLLELEERRRIFITIADNFLHLKTLKSKQ
uniref:p12-5p n=1 Tax=Pyrococcus sp. 12/1 TaxID=758582 RepID=D6MY11_9EURY|nr:hypothetical protein [Pyrococcus sp. 12/1]ADF80212.1 p12-5p [Pyrococcus sp. 12/1]